MSMVYERLKVWLLAGALAGSLVACGKKEEELPPPPLPPASKKAEPTTPKQTEIQSRKPAVTPVQPAAVAQPPLPPSATTAVPSIPALVDTYVSNPDFTKRVETIYQVSDVGTPEAIVALGRLFQMEKDPTLKTEIVDSLFDIDGLDAQKVALLTAASAADQHKDVRESAIDALADVDPKFALPILQSLLSDSDEEIREQAKDQMEQLQAEQDLQKK